MDSNWSSEPNASSSVLWALWNPVSTLAPENEWDLASVRDHSMELVSVIFRDAK